MINDFLHLVSDEDNIISIAFQQMYLFEKKSGKCIREIGIRDKSPNGYVSTLLYSKYDEKNKTIYARDWDKSFCGYNLEGLKITHIKTPKYYLIPNFGILNDSLFFGFNFSYEKNEVFIIFNKNGGIIANIPYWHMIQPHQAIFYNANNSLFFYEIYNDTLFQVKKDTIIPRCLFKLGDLKPPVERRQELEKITGRQESGLAKMLLDNYVVLRHICESQRFILFEFTYKTVYYWGYYDKKSGETKITKNTNDIIINGQKVPFRLTRAFYNQKEQELTTFIPAYELLQWFHTNIVGLSQLPPDLSRLKEIKETDNDLVIIARLKE